MNYKEFVEEDLDLEELKGNLIDQELYEMIHEKTIIVCHDIFLRCTLHGQKGILLVRRLREPAYNLPWPIGGRIKKGVKTEESLAERVMDECSLQIANLQFLGVARTYFKGEPFGHHKGTDTFNLIYVGNGIGEVILNKDHSDPELVTKENYKEMRSGLPEYVRTYMDLIDRDNLW